MARSRIRSRGVQLQSDNGAVQWSLVQGEQLEFSITLNFITTGLTGYAFEASVIEGDNTGNGRIPRGARTNGQLMNLEVVVPDETSNVINVRFPANLIANWNTMPSPDRPVYGFFGLRVTVPRVIYMS